MPRVPSDRSAKLDAIAAAERVAGTVRRQLLAVAQASAASHAAASEATAAAAPTPPARHSGTSASAPPADLLRTSGRLPTSYGSDRLVLLARDPHCLYAYWDVSRPREETVRKEAGSDQLRLVLRTYDVTQIAFDAEPPRRAQDFAVGGDARSLYAYVGKPAACFVAEVGYLRPDGAFFPLARSLPVWTPRTAHPGSAPGRWMTVGWSERRGAGELVPIATTGGAAPKTADAPPSPATASEATRPAVTRPAPASWPGPAPGVAQRGSWSLVRGGLASPTTVDAPPATRSKS